MIVDKNNMFATPADGKGLTNWIDLHNPEDRIHLWTAAVMMQNLIAEKQKNSEVYKLLVELKDRQPIRGARVSLHKKIVNLLLEEI